MNIYMPMYLQISEILGKQRKYNRILDKADTPCKC